MDNTQINNDVSKLTDDIYRTLNVEEHNHNIRSWQQTVYMAMLPMINKNIFNNESPYIQPDVFINICNKHDALHYEFDDNDNFIVHFITKDSRDKFIYDSLNIYNSAYAAYLDNTNNAEY